MCTIGGSDLPIILRPAAGRCSGQENVYGAVVGACYMNGVMDREAPWQCLFNFRCGSDNAATSIFNLQAPINGLATMLGFGCRGLCAYTSACLKGAFHPPSISEHDVFMIDQVIITSSIHSAKGLLSQKTSELPSAVLSERPTILTTVYRCHITTCPHGSKSSQHHKTHHAGMGSHAAGYVLGTERWRIPTVRYWYSHTLPPRLGRRLQQSF